MTSSSRTSSSGCDSTCLKSWKSSCNPPSFPNRADRRHLKVASRRHTATKLKHGPKARAVDTRRFRGTSGPDNTTR